MKDFAARRIPEMDAGFGGAFKRARAEVGATAFGLAVIDLPPNFDGYPEHDHTTDEQEEVYVALSGDGVVEVDGDRRLPLDAEPLVRVGPSHRRRVVPGPDGIRVPAIGGTPGRRYEAPEFTHVGADDDAPRSGPAP